MSPNTVNFIAQDTMAVVHRHSHPCQLRGDPALGVVQMTVHFWEYNLMEQLFSRVTILYMSLSTQTREFVIHLLF